MSGLNGFEDLIKGLALKVAPDILKYGRGQIKEQIEKVQMDFGTAFLNYIDSSKKKYELVKTLVNREKPIGFYDCYVDIDLCSGSDELINTASSLNLLDASKYSIITASAGFGKSTLLKHLFLNTIKNGEYIPVFVELRDYNDNLVSLVDFIYQTMQRKNFTLSIDAFKYALKVGKFLILLDGYDEVHPENSLKVKKEIMDFVDEYSESCFVVSSRPEKEFLSWNNFEEFRVQPLTKEASMELINKIEYDFTVKEKFIERIDKTLYDTHKAFTSNPLLLLIMFLTYEQTADIPNESHVFYRRAFESLYSYHDATKGYKRKMYTDLSESEFIDVLAAFSIQSYMDHNLSFYEKDILEYLKKAKEIVGVKFNEREYLKDLKKSVCIILEDGLKFTYSHKTFQEYFAALFISEKLDDEEQKEFFKQTRPFEDSTMLSFILGINTMKFEKNYIIPYLEVLLEKAKYPGENAWLKFLELTIIHLMFAKGGGCNGYGGVSKKERFAETYMGLTVFARDYIVDVYDCFSGKDDLSSKILEKYLINRKENEAEHHGIIVKELISISEEDEELREALEGIFKPFFDKTVRLYEKLKEKHAQKGKSINDLLRRK